MKRRAFFQLALGAAAAVATGVGGQPAIRGLNYTVYPNCRVSYRLVGRWPLMDRADVSAALVAAWEEKYRQEYLRLSSLKERGMLLL